MATPTLLKMATPTHNTYRTGLKVMGLVFNAKPKAKTKNPLRLDPTKTGAIRRAWMAQVRKRFSVLRKEVLDFMNTKDALGLKPRVNPITGNAAPTPRQYEFLTSAQKVQAFRTWLQGQINAGILELPAGANPATPWTSQYLISAYRKGLASAYQNTPAGKKGAIFGTSTEQAFVTTAFASPETTTKIALLGTRAFENMRGVTDTMASKLNQILAQGMADGSGPLAIARDMVDQIDFSMSRALTVARTETIYAHAEGQIDAFEALGVKKLGVEMEFSTAGDDYVCPICASMEGQVYTTEEARGIIPVHPNCRCSWIPYLGDDDS